jgi:LysR family transcriptional activator of nhaA
MAADMADQFAAEVVGATQVREQFYVVSNERKIQHPAVAAIMAALQPAGLARAEQTGAAEDESVQ